MQQCVSIRMFVYKGHTDRESISHWYNRPYSHQSREAPWRTMLHVGDWHPHRKPALCGFRQRTQVGQITSLPRWFNTQRIKRGLFARLLSVMKNWICQICLKISHWANGVLLSFDMKQVPNLVYFSTYYCRNLDKRKMYPYMAFFLKLNQFSFV